METINEATKTSLDVVIAEMELEIWRINEGKRQDIEEAIEKENHRKTAMMTAGRTVVREALEAVILADEARQLMEEARESLRTGVFYMDWTSSNSKMMIEGLGVYVEWVNGQARITWMTENNYCENVAMALAASRTCWNQEERGRKEREAKERDRKEEQERRNVWRGQLEMLADEATARLGICTMFQMELLNGETYWIESLGGMDGFTRVLDSQKGVRWMRFGDGQTISIERVEMRPLEVNEHITDGRVLKYIPELDCSLAMIPWFAKAIGNLFRLETSGEDETRTARRVLDELVAAMKFISPAVLLKRNENVGNETVTPF
jgi:hypothetical protein